MVGWTIVIAGIILIGIVVVFKWKQHQAGHIAYWQQQRAVEERQGEAASRLPDAQERRQKMNHAKASVERIDNELSRLTESWEHYFESVGHHAAYWQQQRAVEQRQGEAASRLPDAPARRQKMNRAKASVERIDGELSRLTGAKAAVDHHVS